MPQKIREKAYKALPASVNVAQIIPPPDPSGEGDASSSGSMQKHQKEERRAQFGLVWRWQYTITWYWGELQAISVRPAAVAWNLGFGSWPPIPTANANASWRKGMTIPLPSFQCERERRCDVTSTVRINTDVRHSTLSLRLRQPAPHTVPSSIVAADPVSVLCPR
ncbi:hypothetical protein GALMADRAFT_215385 [Galerina marginata CBS 339.88]|uniref:Uncharacterized protein n=1 Tax=Galerina marginata (strain CBS 339.88) TaxID=685588 RepID=A0A067SN18_GALM3|nr:hypothetical protein GALMADRAFT_215385 [Galerina marginata CBS 339.88]